MLRPEVIGFAMHTCAGDKSLGHGLVIAGTEILDWSNRNCFVDVAKTTDDVDVGAGVVLPEDYKWLAAYQQREIQWISEVKGLKMQMSENAENVFECLSVVKEIKRDMAKDTDVKELKQLTMKMAKDIENMNKLIRVLITQNMELQSRHEIPAASASLLNEQVGNEQKKRKRPSMSS